MDELNGYVERKARKKRDSRQKTSIVSKISRYINSQKSSVARKIELIKDAEKREYQHSCQKAFKKYLERHDPKKVDTFSIEMSDGGITTTTINHIITPIVKTVRPATMQSNIKMFSDIQKKLGLTDSDVTMEGYAFLPDKNGVNKHYFASVRRREYRGVSEAKSINNQCIVDYQGFYRTEEGEFVPIKEQNYLHKGKEVRENEFFKALQSSFNVNAELIVKRVEKEERSMA